jgi:hypothetical protein
MRAPRNPQALPAWVKAALACLPWVAGGCGAVAIQHPTSEPPCAGAGCVGWTSLLLSGGRGPEENAVAHEKNLLFAARTLERLGVRREAVFFADGDDPAPDLQQEEPEPRRRLLFAAGLLLDPERDIHEAALAYRDHAFPGAQRADRGSVLRGLAASAAGAAAVKGPEAPDDLLLYVTDHGMQQDDPSNNVIVLWGPRDLSVRDLGTALDAQPPARRVVSVMAQCFSGSFAALAHRGGDPAAPLAAHDRCGFFAAPSDRPAAGCSPRDDENLYDDYTTRFFAALGRKLRGGAPAVSADADGDGRVSFEEAHFAAIALEQTQDVPVSTSEELLRRAHPDWPHTEESAPYERLLEGARPALRAAALALLSASSTPPRATLAEIRRKLEWIQERYQGRRLEAEEQLAAAKLRAHEALRRAAGPVWGKSPAELLERVGETTVKQWIQTAQPHFDEALRQDARAEALLMEAETHQAQLLRLLRMGELQAMERRAAREGGALWSSYLRLRRCEASGPWPRLRGG